MEGGFAGRFDFFFKFAIMDFQYWLYIIIGIIYLISQFRKKSDQEEHDIPDPQKPARNFEQPQTGTSPERHLTFEELLREITEGKTPAQPKAQEVSRRKVDYEVDLEEEGKSQEDVATHYRRDDEIYKTYEEAKRQAFERPSLEETMKLADTEMSFGKFKAFEHVNQPNLVQTYLADLKDPDGLKKAVVMSEILQRKF